MTILLSILALLLIFAITASIMLAISVITRQILNSSSNNEL